MQATVPSVATPYPVHVEGHLERPSRWLWLVKWLLAVPHYLVLAFLWLAFVLLSVVAFLALLFGLRYPRGIFDFNLGVLRWTWRVAFYAYSANGTDRYPPFTLGDVPDYPARLEITYPENQRHGLPLIGWWLLGVPQYLVAGIFAGGGAAGWRASESHWSWGLGSAGLIGLLVLVAVVVLLFRGAYPRSIFDLVLGLNRWVIRVGAYAALMTRDYPPFRLDAGEDDPGGLTVGRASAPYGWTTSVAEAEARAERWGPGRVLAIVLGSLAVLASLAALAAGGIAVVFDQTQRDANGYLMTSTTTYSTGTYAIVSDSYRTGTANDWFVARDLLGNVRIHVRSASPVFVGIGPATAVESYLAGVRHEVARSFDASRSRFRLHAGGAPTQAPAAKGFWAVDTAGRGVQELTWSPRNGDWRVVLMNADGSPNVTADLSVGARFPHLLGIGIGLLSAGGALLLIGSLAIYGAASSRRRSVGY
jgi:Domain of unknown function (DUF4389)